ncbi:MAG: glycosyltransferase [Candidatus Buchananbacteria bacterium]
MKIAVIHSIYQPYTRGGAEVMVSNVVSGLKNRGHEVFVIAVGYENKMEVIGGVKVYRIKPFNLFNFLAINDQPAWRRLFWHLIDMFNDVQTWRIYKVLAAEKPELALTHNLKGLGYQVPPLLKLLKIKHIHTIHDMQLIHPSGLIIDDPKFKLNFFVRLYARFCRELFNNPDVVVFPSDYIRLIYRRYKFFTESKVEILGNPLLVKPQRTKTAKSDIFTLAFIGQLELYKGIIDLIKAVNRLSGNWRLLIAGAGQAEKEARRVAIDNQRIKFLGHLDQAELEHKIWSEADLLVNPSRTAESFGMVVIESYAHGVPVIASKIGALPELVKDGSTGWLIKPGNPDDLKRQLEFIIDNRDHLTPLVEKCLAEAEKYTIDNYLNRLLEL